MNLTDIPAYYGVLNPSTWQITPEATVRRLTPQGSWWVERLSATGRFVFPAHVLTRVKVNDYFRLPFTECGGGLWKVTGLIEYRKTMAASSDDLVLTADACQDFHVDVREDMKHRRERQRRESAL